MRTIIAAATLLLAAVTARAELVADTTIVTSKNTAILIQLSSIKVSKAKCGMPGMRGVLLQVMDKWTFPRSTPYADGCWTALRDGHVMIYGKLFNGEGTFYKKLPVSDFSPGPGFTSWRAYWLSMEDLQAMPGSGT